MTYPEALRYLESFINYEKIPSWPYKESLKLERIKNFLAAINNPQDNLRCIHIAGTKGKGSTCAFAAYILRQAGYKIGVYTSPHLSDFRERIRILATSAEQRAANTDFEGMISKKELAGLVERLKPYIEKFNKESGYGPLSFFEVYTALALVYFKDKKADFVVLETGLGGRLDATNAVNPLVCAITPISYEHTQKLGNSLRAIAAEKAGIIKVGWLASYPVSRLSNSNPQTREPANPRTLFVISAPQEKEVIEVIRNRCKETGANLYEVGKDILYEIKGGGFNVKGIYDEYLNLTLKLLGKHQIVNASAAVGIIEALRNYNIDIGVDSVRKGLYNTLWPGRCEVIAKRPLIIVDGAQNAASAKVLNETIKDAFKYKKLILVLGISNDKDISGICRELCPSADTIILTQANNPRAADVNTIERIIRRQEAGGRRQIIKMKNVKEAKAQALRLAKKEDLILITGSLFVVGEFRNDKIHA